MIGSVYTDPLPAGPPPQSPRPCGPTAPGHHISPSEHPAPRCTAGPSSVVFSVCTKPFGHLTPELCHQPPDPVSTCGPSSVLLTPGSWQQQTACCLWVCLPRTLLGMGHSLPVPLGLASVTSGTVHPSFLCVVALFLWLIIHCVDRERFVYSLISKWTFNHSPLFRH